MLEGFVSEDRRRALVAGTELPEVVSGSALSCDLVGYSALAAGLLAAHGRRQGTEVLHRTLEGTLARIVRGGRLYGGFPLAFAGDSLTLWFGAVDGDCATSAAQAAAAARHLALSAEGPQPGLRLAIASGSFARHRFGSAAFGWLECLGGASIQQLAAMDRLASADTIVVCPRTAELLGNLDAELRPIGDGRGFRLGNLPQLPAQPLDETVLADPALAQDWIPGALRDAVKVLGSGQTGESPDLSTLAEIRPVTAVLVLAGKPDTQGDQATGSGGLSALVSDLQADLHRRGGLLLDIHVDGKGTYLSCVFGAPVAHEDDLDRALGAAMDAARRGSQHGLPVQIGIARGTGLAGLIAADTFLRYGVISAAMNQAASLMARAEPGCILATLDIAERMMSRFEFVEAGSHPDGSAAKHIPGWRLVGEAAEASQQSRAGDDDATLVERDEILSALHGAALSDTGGLTLVEAPPGYGKSALLAQIRRSVEAEARLWLNGRAESQSSDVPFHAWFPIIAALLDQARAVPVRAESVEVLAWLLEPQSISPARLEGLVGSERAVAIAKAVVDVLGAVQAAAPVTLVIDDLHWADTPSLGLLLAIVNSALPVAVICATRPVQPSSMEAAMLFGHPAARKLTLQPLSEPGTIALATSALDVTSLSYDLQRLFADHAAGSPLFVHLIADVLKRRGLVTIEDGHCKAAAAQGSLTRYDFLDSEEAAVLARFDVLSDDVKRALRIASVLGRSFTRAALGAALTPQDASLADTRGVLLASGYVTETIERGESGFRFVHPLVQKAIGDSVSLGLKMQINRRLADYLEDSSTPSALVGRARHLLGTLRPEDRDPALLKEVIAALEAAAGQAASNAGHLEASDLLETAADLARRLPDAGDTARLRLHLQAGLAFSMSTFRGYGDPSVEAAYSAALALADEAENTEDLAFTIYGLFSFYASRGDYAKAMPIVWRLHRLALHFDDLRVASIAHQSRAILSLLRGRPAAAATLARKSIEDADRIGHGRFFPHGGAGDFRIFSGTWLALALAVSGRLPEAEDAWQRARSVDRADSFALGFLHCFCPLPVLAGTREQALAYADDMVAEASSRGFALFSVVGGIYAGWAAAELGQDDARVSQFLNMGIHIAQSMGLGSFTPWFLTLAARAHLLRGDVEAAEGLVATASAMITASGGGLFEAEVLHANGLVREARGDAASAARSFAEARSLRRKRGLVVIAPAAVSGSPVAASAQEIQPGQAAGSRAGPETRAGHRGALEKEN